MTDMRQYVCWKDTTVGTMAPLDAAALKPGHFQAVHHPLKLRQRRLDAKDEGNLVEETDVVRALESPLTADGYLFIPIVGGSGTGKSHLVRWVHDRTQNHTNWEQRYLAKNDTTIRRVIEIVIAGLEGPAVKAAEKALLSAPAQSKDEGELRELLLDQLAVIISRKSPAVVGEGDQKTAELTKKLRRELPDLLRDPVVRRRLTGEGAVISRLVKVARSGRRNDDGLNNDAKKVVEADLPLVMTEIGEASKGVQGLLCQMAAIPELVSGALRLINEALPAAIRHVFIGGTVDLIVVFREIRRELKTAGKELVLFIEDLTVLQGLEREFLDAIIEPASSKGGDLCPLRVLLAITEGHFDSLDTVRTRVDDAYWLDAPYGPEGVGTEEAISFLGRYLNACRHDPEEVSDRWTKRERESETWIPNACDDCQYKVSCHETFGTSEEGYGIYPFNSAAINHFVDSLSIKGFDPRLIVRELVKRFLRIASGDLTRGEFPSNELIDRFNKYSAPLPALYQSTIKQHRPSDFKRVINSIRYWADQTGRVGDATLAAFGIDPLEDLETILTLAPRGKSQATTKGVTVLSGIDEVTTVAKPITSRLGAPWGSIFDALDTWINNKENLTLKATNELKKLVHKSVSENLDYSALPFNLGSEFNDQKLFDLQKDIFIVGSKTAQNAKEPKITIERDADTAAALQGLILLKKFPDDADYSEVDNYRRKAARYLEHWTLLVTSRLEQPPEPEAIQAIEDLVLSAIVLGMCDGASEPHDHLSAIFGGPVTPERLHRTPKWQKVVNKSADKYQACYPVVTAQFGESRGAGSPRAVRADQILSIIQDFTQAKRFDSSNASTNQLMQSTKTAVEVEWDQLRGHCTNAAPFVDSSRPWSEQTGKVLELIEKVHKAGWLSDHDAMHDLRELSSVTGDDAPKILHQTARLLASDPPLIRRLQEIASDRPDSVAATSKFVNRARKAMDSIENDLDERSSNSSADENAQDVTKDVLKLLERLAIAIKEIES